MKERENGEKDVGGGGGGVDYSREAIYFKYFHQRGVIIRGG